MQKLLQILALSSVFTLSLGTLTSCQESTGTTSKATLDERAVNIKTFPSVLRQFSCKAKQHAFVAAHRGTHEGSVYPENALGSLKALHKSGVLFAEIDVARLKDGTQILYHDGTWERGSTGKGPIAKNTWVQSQKFLLKDTNKNITTYHPSSFADVLSWAKDKMYLEIDFKSSVNEEIVVEAIRSANMLDQVILIAYNNKQAVRLHSYAPNAALSVGVFKPSDIKTLNRLGIPTKVMTAWTGKPPIKKDVINALRKHKIPVLAPSFYALDEQLQKNKNFSDYKVFSQEADLVVTDFAFDTQKALEITGDDLGALFVCLYK